MIDQKILTLTGSLDNSHIVIRIVGNMSDLQGRSSGNTLRRQFGIESDRQVLDHTPFMPNPQGCSGHSLQILATCKSEILLHIALQDSGCSDTFPPENLSRSTRFDRSVIGCCRPIEIVISRRKKQCRSPRYGRHNHRHSFTVDPRCRAIVLD